MSSLKELSLKYPDVLPPGTSLQEASEIYIRLFEGRAKAHLEDTTLIVLQELSQKNVVRGWLLFDPFKKSTVTLMEKISCEYFNAGITIHTTTRDPRMLRILQRIGFKYRHTIDAEYFLVLGA